MTFGRVFAALVIGLALNAFLAWALLAARGGDYRTVATVPAYAAGYARADDPPPAAADADAIKRLEGEIAALRQDVIRILKLLEDAAADDPPRAGAGRDDEPPPSESAQALVPRQLSRADEAEVVRQVQSGKMPKRGEPLGAAEKRAVVDAYSGRRFDQAAFAAGMSRCVQCHSPEAGRTKQGGGLVLFDPEPRRRP